MSDALSTAAYPDDDEHREPENTDTSGGETVTPSTGQSSMPRELGGPRGPEPTRYGDWESKGRCSDF